MIVLKSEAVKSLKYHTNKEKSTYSLNGVLFEIKKDSDGIRSSNICALDGRSLFLMENVAMITNEHYAGRIAEDVLPEDGKYVLDISKVKPGNGVVYFYYAADTWYYLTGKKEGTIDVGNPIEVPIISGRFPNYKLFTEKCKGAYEIGINPKLIYTSGKTVGNRLYISTNSQPIRVEYMHDRKLFGQEVTSVIMPILVDGKWGNDENSVMPKEVSDDLEKNSKNEGAIRRLKKQIVKLEKELLETLRLLKRGKTSV